MSIYLAIEVFKFLQVQMVHSDTSMNNPQLANHLLHTPGEEHVINETNAVQIKNPEVLENLGDINLFLTDKTGTLTQNNMIFQKLYCLRRIRQMKHTDFIDRLGVFKIHQESID